jgi:YesN/AraC family two-component response regulator
MPSKGTILIVDDQQKIIESLQKQLSRREYTVFIAISGEVALKILEKEAIDILLTDIRMPGMGGIELMKIAKKKYSDLQIIVITGQGNYELAIDAMAAGAINFLRKPTQMDADVIAAALEKGMEVVNYLKELKDKNIQLLQLTDKLDKANKELDEKNKKLAELLNESKEECLRTKADLSEECLRTEANLLMQKSYSIYGLVEPGATKSAVDFAIAINEYYKKQKKKEIWSVTTSNGANVAKILGRWLNNGVPQNFDDKNVTATGLFILQLIKQPENSFVNNFVNIEEYKKLLNEFISKH